MRAKTFVQDIDLYSDSDLFSHLSPTHLHVHVGEVQDRDSGMCYVYVLSPTQYIPSPERCRKMFHAVTTLCIVSCHRMQVSPTHASRSFENGFLSPDATRLNKHQKN